MKNTRDVVKGWSEDYGRLIAAFLFIVALGTGFYFARPALAAYIWNTFHLEYVATTLDPHNAALHEAVGTYYFSTNNYDIQKAKRYLEVAISLNNNDPLAHYQLGRIHFINGDFEDAISEMDTHIMLFPDYKRAYYVRGLIYGFMNEYDKAIADFKEFLVWKPDSWAGHNDLSWVYFRRGDYADARAAAAVGLAVAPGNPWLLNALGVALLNLDEDEDAKVAFREALSRFEVMGPMDWGRAYPGNDPRVYEGALQQTKESIRFNLNLLEEDRPANN